MKSIGKTYLIEVEKPKIECQDGIFIPQTVSSREMVYYIGKIVGYGIGFSEDEIKELIPINTKVVMDYSKGVQRTKTIMSEKIYYIYKPENILCIIEE